MFASIKKIIKMGAFLALGGKASLVLATTFYHPHLTIDNLGRGIESSQGYLRGFCVSGNPEFVSSPFFVNHIFYDKSLQDILSYSEKHGRGGFNLGVIGGSASFTGIEKMAKKSKTLSFVYYLHQRYGDWILQDRQVSVIGKSLPLDMPRKHRQVCGDQVLLKARAGIEVYVGVTIDFDSEDNYRLAKEKHKVSSIFGSKSKTKISEVFSGQGQTRISVYVWQLGGGSGLLASHLNGNLSMSCQRENIAVCDKYFDKIQRYLDEEIIPSLGTQQQKPATSDLALFFEAATYKEAFVPSIQPSAEYEKDWGHDRELKNLAAQIISLQEQINQLGLRSDFDKQADAQNELDKMLGIYYRCDAHSLCEVYP